MLPRTLLTFMADNGGPMIPPVCNGGLRGGKGTPCASCSLPDPGHSLVTAWGKGTPCGSVRLLSLAR